MGRLLSRLKHLIRTHPRCAPYRRLRQRFKPARPYRIVYNVNGVDESRYRRRALLLYVIRAFVTKPDDRKLLLHQNARQCRQIAGLLDEFGYVVDVKDIRDRQATPPRCYDLLISNRSDVPDIDQLCSDDAIKIYLATTLNPAVHNGNVRRRHDLMAARRGCQVRVRRRYGEAMPFVARADAIVGFGNDYTMGTWRSVFSGPIYPFNNYGFKETRAPSGNKDFEAARRRFLFFASGSQMQKGLDLLLEIFPRHSDLELYVCSQFGDENDFATCYRNELYKTKNVHPIGRIYIDSRRFRELMAKCAYVILPSCSEGQSGSVVQCMYAGLIPLVTREAGIDASEFGITFADDSLEEIERVVLSVSSRPAVWHREQSLRSRRVAEREYSEAAFVDRWREMLREILRRHARESAASAPLNG